MDRKERIAANTKKVGSFIGVVMIVITLILAVLGVLTIVGEVPAFLEGAGRELVETISVGDVVSIIGDEDGDGTIDFQVTVESLSALRDVETGEVFLSATGSLSILGR